MDALGLQSALDLAEGAATVREAAALLRARIAPLRVVVVDAFDMRAEPPIVEGPRTLLWLGASDGHCWQVTSDPGQAAGLFIAARS